MDDVKSPKSSTSARRATKVCRVCGDWAIGNNFDAITCESCKAFFRRNALSTSGKRKCPFDDKCVITTKTRRYCKKCRMAKCFAVGMTTTAIITDEAERSKYKRPKTSLPFMGMPSPGIAKTEEENDHPCSPLLTLQQIERSMRASSSTSTVAFDQSPSAPTVDDPPSALTMDTPPGPGSFPPSPSPGVEVDLRLRSLLLLPPDSLTSTSHNTPIKSIVHQVMHAPYTKNNAEQALLEYTREQHRNAHYDKALQGECSTSSDADTGAFGGKTEDALAHRMPVPGEEKTFVSNICWTSSDAFRLNELLSASYFLTPLDSTETQSTSTQSRSIPDLPSLYHLFDATLRSLIQMLRHITAFNQLDMNDQSNIIKCASMEMTVLRNTTYCDLGDMSWRPVRLMEEERNNTAINLNVNVLKMFSNEEVYASRYRWLRGMNPEWTKDRHLMCLLIMMCAFNPRRAHFNNMKLIETQYDIYKVMLQRHLLRQYNDVGKAIYMFNILMHKLDELRVLSNATIKDMFETVAKVNSHPLLTEVFLAS